MIVSLLQTATLVLMGAAGLLFFLRILRGPSAQDRILSLEGLTLVAVGYLLFQGDRGGGHYYLDTALTLALLSFVATVALSLSLGSRDDD